jgi:hypothetical protein
MSLLQTLAKQSHARYVGPIVCYACGAECSDGYAERFEQDSDGGYAETLYYCTPCDREGK